MKAFNAHRSICKALLKPLPVAKGKPGERGRMPTSPSGASITPDRTPRSHLPPSPSAALPLRRAPRKQPCLPRTPSGRGRGGRAHPGVPAGVVRLLGLESHSAGARLCHGQRRELSRSQRGSHDPLVAPPATFPAWAEVLPGPRATPRTASHSRDDCTPLLAARLRRRWVRRGAARCPAPRCRGAVPPTPEPHAHSRAGWSGLQQFINCKTSLGSAPSNLGSFLIAGTCPSGETGAV